jgi:hypothetical protein
MPTKVVSAREVETSTQSTSSSHAALRTQLPDLYQNSQTLTHAAGALPGHPLQKRTEVQWDIGAAVDADDGADESTSPQAGIMR